MILKVKRYADNEDWIIFDNIRKVSKVNLKVSDFLEDPKRDLEEDPKWEADVLVLDYYNSLADPHPEGLDCILLRCKAIIGDEGFSVAFDTVAYLCNDLGQTVEKIVANYIMENFDRDFGE